MLRILRRSHPGLKVDPEQGEVSVQEEERTQRHTEERPRGHVATEARLEGCGHKHRVPGAPGRRTLP